MNRKYVISALILAAASVVGSAQETVGRNPGASLLMSEYGISATEAQLRIDLQEQVIALSEKLNSDADPAYADMYIQHEPVYRIIISFSDKKDRKAFVDQIDPKIRRYVQLRNANKSRKETNQNLDSLALSLKDSGVAYLGGFDVSSDKFRIMAETDADVQKLTGLIPANLKNDTLVTRGPVPKMQAAPFGIQSGDKVTTGTTVFTSPSNTSGYCTLGYVVSYLSGSTPKRGILTAGHCDSTMYFSVNGHWVTLNSPIVDYATGSPVGTKYDYQIWEVTGLASNNDIYYRNLNSIPEFPASGTLKITSITSFLNQKFGMVVCKSGATTGITCGKIVDGNAIYNGVPGWIQVSHTRQIDISQPGDSGGPWFIYPGTATNVSGAGVHTAGSGTGTSGVSIYMPIDYIDDHIISVNTVKQ